MTEFGIEPEALIEALLELADRAKLEIRVLSPTSTSVEFTPTESATCRVGQRIWVVLAPDDPVLRQSEVLARALVRYRADFIEKSFMAPGVRDFIEHEVDAQKSSE